MTSLYIFSVVLIFAQLLFAKWANTQMANYHCSKYLFSVSLIILGLTCVTISLFSNKTLEFSFASIGVTMIITAMLTVPLITLLFNQIPLSRKESNY